MGRKKNRKTRIDKNKRGKEIATSPKKNQTKLFLKTRSKRRKKKCNKKKKITKISGIYTKRRRSGTHWQTKQLKNVPSDLALTSQWWWVEWLVTFKASKTNLVAYHHRRSNHQSRWIGIPSVRHRALKDYWT